MRVPVIAAVRGTATRVVVNDRLDAVTHRVGQSMEQQTRSTMDQLRHLHERLAVIDNAHKNLTDMTTQDLTTIAQWASSDVKVGTISNTPGTEGVAFGVAPGQTTITATSAGVTGSTTLTVTLATLVSISVDPANQVVASGKDDA